MKHQKGFTLIELTIVIVILSILSVVLLVGRDKQIAQARNTERVYEIKAINDATQQYFVDHSSWPANLKSTLTEVCDSNLIPKDCINLIPLTPNYLTEIPQDPLLEEGTGYLISVVNGRINIVARESIEHGLELIDIGLNKYERGTYLNSVK